MLLHVRRPWLLLSVPLLLVANKALLLSTRSDPKSRNAVSALCDVVRGHPSNKAAMLLVYKRIDLLAASHEPAALPSVGHSVPCNCSS